jgi:hypothetical protein
MAAHSTPERLASSSEPPSKLPSTRDRKSEPHQAGPATKRRKWLRVSAAVIGAALLLFVALVRIFWPFTEAKVKAAIEEDWPGEVEIGGFRPLIFPHPGCIAQNVKLSLRSGSQTVAIISVDLGRLESRYSDFLWRPHFVAQLVLNGFRVHLPDKGKWRTLHGSGRSSENLTANRYGEIIADNSSLTIERAPDKQPLLFSVYHLKLMDIRRESGFTFETWFHNAIPPGEIAASGRFGPWNSADFQKSPVSGGYQFRDARLGVFEGISGMLASTGHFSGTIGRIAVDGRTDTPDFRVTSSRHSVSLHTDFSAVVNGKNGDVVLRQVNAKFLETGVLAKGSIAGEKGEHGKTAVLDIEIPRGAINDVLRLFVKAPEPPMRGPGSFRAHVTIPSGPEHFLNRVILDGDFLVREAKFTNLERQKDINDLSWRASGKKEKDKKKFKAKDANYHTRSDQGEAEPVAMEFHSHLRLVNGVANFSGLEMTVPGAEAHLAGNYHIHSEKVDIHGDLKTEAPLSKEASGIKAVLLKPLDPFFKHKKAGAVVPVGITGSYDHPHFGMELPSKTPPAPPQSPER